MKKIEVGYGAVRDGEENPWPFRGQLHGSASLARRFLLNATFPNHDYEEMWRKLRKGGWRIATFIVREQRR